MTVRSPLVVALFTVVAVAAPAQQAERIDAELNAKIRAEEIDHSKIMWIEHYLTDVYGPRPIGSPNHVAAANWAMKTMTSQLTISAAAGALLNTIPIRVH